MTINWILEKNFAEHAIKFDVKEKHGHVLPLDLVQENLYNHPGIKSFSSHQVRFPLPQTTDFNLLPIVFIRNPIDRAFSLYYAQKKQSVRIKTPLTEKAQNMTPREFFRWCLDSNFYYVMKNFQTIFLSSRDNHHEASYVDFNQAIQRMKDCTILGLVDRFDESMVLAEEILQDYFKDVDLSYIKRNVNPNRKRDYSERFDSEKLLIGDVLMEKLFQCNKLDLQLYSSTNKELNYRIKKIESFDKKLIDFKKRCKKNRIGKTENIHL